MVNLTEKEKNILLNLIEHEMNWLGDEIENSPYYEEGLDRECAELFEIKLKLKGEIA